MTSTVPHRPTAAAFCMVGAMCIIGAIDIYVAVIAQTISVWQFLILRLVMAAPIILALSAMGLGTVRPRRVRAVAVRSTLIATGMFCYFGALAFMPIAMALAGLFTSPIFVLLLTAFVLRQRIGPWRIIAVAVGFVGILVVLGPSGGSLGWVALLPVVGGILYASGVVATRALCEGESTLTLLLGIFVAQGLLGTGVLTLLTLSGLEPGQGGMAFLTRGWIWPIDAVWPYLSVQVVGSVVGVSLLNRAYQMGEASHVAVFEYSIMIFGPFFGWWLLGQPVTWVQGLGIALIVLAGVIIAVRSREAVALDPRSGTQPGLRPPDLPPEGKR
ncbi:DMT family transporter [uncultured Tateyamaria sp.]|uniref:DMT family transporter n=1 Tax=uncultured Tateyamaria sp. TaxID=455651 RepID=UPI002619C3CE|nr:DMT family transporter [uncultured Tateyamaria sp.]